LTFQRFYRRNKPYSVKAANTNAPIRMATDNTMRARKNLAMQANAELPF
jgi:hypothetical protein